MVVGWKKGMTSMAHTYMAEVTLNAVWFGRLGAGGAHWDPDYHAMAMAQVRLANWQPGATASAVGGAALGRAIGNKVLSKFTQEIGENATRYATEGRSALAHKATFEATRAEMAQITRVDKVPSSGPPALKGLPAAKTKLEGKDWYFFEIPSGPSIDEFIDLVVRGH